MIPTEPIEEENHYDSAGNDSQRTPITGQANRPRNATEDSRRTDGTSHGSIQRDRGPVDQDVAQTASGGARPSGRGTLRTNPQTAPESSGGADLRGGDQRTHPRLGVNPIGRGDRSGLGLTFNPEPACEIANSTHCRRY